jgi:hypothetical protein
LLQRSTNQWIALLEDLVSHHFTRGPEPERSHGR